MEETQITVLDLGVKAKSKREVYRLLSTEGDVYMPPEKEANYDYLATILKGDKRVSLPISLDSI